VKKEKPDQSLHVTGMTPVGMEPLFLILFFHDQHNNNFIFQKQIQDWLVDVFNTD